MKIKSGKIYAITGHNGCGKTRCLNRLFHRYYNKQIIYIQQNHFLNDHFTVENNLQFHHYHFHNDRINAMIKDIKTLYPAQISLGQRQMVAIICALYHPYNQLILFDETLSGLTQEHCSFFMDLCHKHINNKTIMIVTHQKEIIDLCDIVINLEDQNLMFELEDITDKPIHHVDFQHVLMFFKKDWFKHLTLSCLLAFCFLFISLTAYYRNMTYQNLQNKISQYTSTECFILNNTNIYYPYKGNYNIAYCSIPSSQQEQLQNIAGLKNFQAFIPFSLPIKRNNDQLFYDPLYLIENNQKVKKEISIQETYFIHPYTAYSRMDESILYQTSHDNGIILTQSFCDQLNIDKEHLDNLQIEMNVAVPVSQTDHKNALQTAIVDETGEITEFKDIEGRDIEYQEVSMTFFIKGILDEGGPFLSRDSAFGYLPQEIMQDLFDEMNIDYVPNAYFAQITDLFQYQVIQNQVEQISPTLEFYCVYNTFYIPDITSTFIKTLSLMTIIPLCLFLFIVVYVNIIQWKSHFKHNEKLLTSGYHIKMCYQWICKQYLIDYIVFIVIYSLLFIIGKGILKYIHFPTIHINGYLIGISFILLCLLPMGVDIYALYKKYACGME